MTSLILWPLCLQRTCWALTPPPLVLTTNPLLTQLLAACCSHLTSRPDLPLKPCSAPCGLRTNNPVVGCLLGPARLQGRVTFVPAVVCFPEFPEHERSPECALAAHLWRPGLLLRPGGKQDVGAAPNSGSRDGDWDSCSMVLGSQDWWGPQL